MEVKEFLSMVIRIANNNDFKFVYMPKELSGSKISGLFVLEKLDIESDSDSYGRDD